MTTTAVSTPNNLPPEFAEMINTLADVATSENDGLGASVQIAASILAAGSRGVDAIMEASDAGTTSGEDYLNTPFRVRTQDVSWRKSGDQFKDQGGFPYYALVRTTDVDGTPMVLSCGGQSVVPTLFALWDNDHLEGDGLVFVLSTVRTGSNYDLLKLRLAPSNGKAK